jgi:hypothetical protein
MPGPINQDHPMIPRQQIAERLPHRLEIGTGAMDHHDRWTGSIARPDVDDIERRSGDLDRPALRRISALQDHDTGLRD